jgi:hypothetical protein
MANPPHAAELPPVEIVLSEVVANLSFIAQAYLAQPGVPSGAEASGLEQEAQSAQPSRGLEAADIAIDVAGRAFDRIQARLGPEERAALARSLTSVRMMYVRERDR